MIFRKRIIVLFAAVSANWAAQSMAIPLTDGVPYSEFLSKPPSTCTSTPCTSQANEYPPIENRAPAAFDGLSQSYWMAGGVQNIFCGPTYSCSFAGHLYWYTNGILGYRLTRPVHVYEYEITPSGNTAYAPKNWTFEGFSSATGWRVLDTVNDYFGFSAGTKSVFPLVNPGMYSDYRLRVNTNYGGDQLQIAEFTLQGIPLGARFDVDGNRKSEQSVYRPDKGEWILHPVHPRIRPSAPPVLGQGGDQIVPHDYNGDGKTDLAVWRPATGQWIAIHANENFDNPPVNLGTLGLPSDIPMPGDYDGDGKADLAVYRPSTSQWIQVWSSRNYNSNQAVTKQFGVAGDKPVSGDFDGDGKIDLTIWSPTQRAFSVSYSKTNLTESFPFERVNGLELPAPGDYDGDGKTDFALYQAATAYWFIRSSRTGGYSMGRVGGMNGIPVVADYDGDGKSDIGYWNPSTNQWTVRYSKTSTEATITHGRPGDLPLPAAFVH